MEKSLNEESILINAIENSNFDFARKLIQNNANVNETDKFGKNILILALEKSNYELVNDILNNPTIQDNTITMALIREAGFGNIENLEYVLNSLDDPAKYIDNNLYGTMTPMKAAVNRNQKESIDILLKYKNANPRKGITTTMFFDKKGKSSQLENQNYYLLGGLLLLGLFMNNNR